MVYCSHADQTCWDIERERGREGERESLYKLYFKSIEIYTSNSFAVFLYYQLICSIKSATNPAKTLGALSRFQPGTKKKHSHRNLANSS